MNVCSIEWVVCLLVLSAFFFCLPSPCLRQGLLAVCNLAFVATLVPDVRAWIALSGFLISGYLVAKMLQAHSRRWVLVTYLAVLVSAFVILKQYAFAVALLPASLFHRVVAVVGLSYMLFRQIQLVVDAYQGQIENLTVWNYLNYQLNLFGLVAGPIQRYQQFLESWARLEPILAGPEPILRAYSRVFIGVLKISVVAAACLAVFD
jgi:D-alanyl-lipoteichoic acid acyltransferase DltB (MBOAT superfamily)